MTTATTSLWRFGAKIVRHIQNGRSVRKKALPRAHWFSVVKPDCAWLRTISRRVGTKSDSTRDRTLALRIHPRTFPTQGLSTTRSYNSARSSIESLVDQFLGQRSCGGPCQSCCRHPSPADASRLLLLVNGLCVQGLGKALWLLD